MICVSIGRTRHKMVVLEHRALAERGAELVELRIDWLQRKPDLGRLLRDRPTPCVITCRRREDRGRWAGSEDQRQALLREAIVAGADYVDLEADVAKVIRRYGSTKRIVSHHDFDETPDDLEAIYEEMCGLDPDIVKLVTMANSPGDGVRLLRLVERAEVPTIAFCMGEFGIFSRVLCGKYGAPFTYASFTNERELAPGQIPFDDMKRLYRYDEIDAETQVFGVLADPVGHSLSPAVHNAAFAAEGINAVYLPFRVPKGALQQTLHDFHQLEVRGYSVTIPHKEAILAQVQEPDEEAVRIGAANTLYRGDSGQWQASNTDYSAALDSMRLGLQRGRGGDPVLAGKRVLMLGAGGVARAIGLALVRVGAALTICNRTHARAVALAEELGCSQCQWENRGAGYYDMLINCTPVGMHPDVDESPFAETWLQEEMLVFDTIYNPENTLLLKRAKLRGCRTVTGVEMFVRQAAAQFEKFAARPAPLELMERTVRQAISAVRR